SASAIEKLRDAGVWHQTRSLLYKNLLIKWRTKQQSLQALLGLLILISTLNPHVSYGSISTKELEYERDLSLKGLGYTPINNVTNHIMEEVARELCTSDLLLYFFLKFFFLQDALMKREFKRTLLFEMEIFCNIRFLQCFYGNRKLLSGMIFCFHNYVFILLQMKTKRPVWNELKVRAVMMGHPGSVEVQKFPHALISIYLVLAFTPFVSFLIVNVAAEKEQRLKDTMSMMGLYDSAFWLSWGLLYAALVTTMSILMAVIATCTPLFSNSNFFVIFLLIFLYGISSIFFSFMLTPLFKKPKFASTVGSMLTVVFGCLSLFTVLMRDFPQSAVWLLCLLSPSAFSIGIAQVVYLEAQGDGAVFSSLGNGPHALYVPMVMLFLDCILYLLLAIYLDQVLPGEFGPRRSVLYFLQPSYWSKRRKRYVEVSSLYEGEVNGTPVNDESVEAVSPEFRGKEVIRICNIRKMYREKDTKVEALRGLTFDIYEGQITALLGHSGAGKSTLMNILCGICPPTEGTATIYGSPVAEIADGAEMKQLVGICPQFNIIFDVLTVEEHLRIFAAIKGILPSDIDGEVRKVLRDLDLEKIMDAQAKNLSGGQKRKLSVGLVLTEEPYFDHFSLFFHQSFTAQSHTYLCVFCHTDRKAVISQGQLKCVGSSLYLKTKCGVGYHLRMSVTEGCEVENITSLVKQHVPKAQLSRQQEAELTFTLPFESMDTFPGLFAELDCRPDLGIINYGVSMTTLEDVFLRLEAEAEVDQADYSVFNQEKVDDEGDASSMDDTDQRLLTFSDSRQDAVTGRALWRQQFSTVAWLHMLNLQRERKPIIYNLTLFLVFLSAMLILSVATGNIQIHSPERLFSPIYLLHRNEAPRKYTTSLLVQNSTDSDLSGFIHNLESQDIKVEMMKKLDYMSAAPVSAAINVTGSSKDFTYILAFNSTTVHSLPMSVSVLSNALLRGFNSTGHIRTWTKPFDYQIPDKTSYALVYIEAVILGMLAAGMPAYFAMDHTRDKECRSTLRISGLVPSAYWCGQAAIDVPFYYLILICMTSTLFAFHSTNLQLLSLLHFQALCLIGFAPAMVLFTYCVSFMFVRVQSNRDFFSVVSMLVSLQETFPQLSNNLNNKNKTCSCGKTWKYQVILNQNSKAQRNPEENVSEDEDVQVEKARVKEALTCQCCEEKPVVVVSNLKKQYKGKREGFSLSKRRKVATKNVSFCVRKGEVLGLLGPNGAGKSTIMHMLSGDTEPTAGQILMGDYGTDFQPVENPLEHVGYCPQVNPLWPRITLQEHLEIYAAIKGLCQRDIPNIIKRVVNALELKDHLYKQAKNLSAGLKRKLCFALSMLGNPQIVLLDEPSTGMDPKSKQRMWRAIRAAFKNKQRGALLTTHYMEEAEAVCDRVAIMVSGQLRCIGSIQHLKGKFGRGYSLEINLREELTGLQQVALLHKEILKIFPHAARQDSFATLMVYKIPMEDVKSLAKSFAQLESAKQNFNFEEYNFSQSTFEQVFMEFAKEQENEEEEVGSLSTTFQWQRLRQDVPVSINHADSIVHQL
uniref:ATP-binding cassette sub-family A member 5-like n=1 Tax=Sinocyclocheilus rhinocerous TaxID=307959 RepID=A0A673MMD4_9TELE